MMFKLRITNRKILNKQIKMIDINKSLIKTNRINSKGITKGKTILYNSRMNNPFTERNDLLNLP